MKWPAILASMLICVAVDAAPAGRQPLPPSAPRFEVAMGEASIPMPDGVRLAADIWRPQGKGANGRFPVLLEYLPYRKTESRGDRYALYAYFVRRGYVVARVDIRGTGNSEGQLIPYEYSDIENRDGDAVIAWLAKQPWSSGKVGMFGISWGGFNSIHMAMRRPPALKAIVAVDATDDLYQDDVHFMDGVMHVDDWEMNQDLRNAMPGAPEYRIDEAYFRDRFDQPPWGLTYKRQQRDGPFWDRTSLKTRYESIQAPTLMIGGWYDGYRDSVPRMLEHLEAPAKGIVGAWNHTFPQEPYPKPGFEGRYEMVRWFDRWLKGRDTGIMDEPRLAVYVRQWHPPGPYLESAPGAWRFEDGWPLADAQQRVLYPRADHALADAVPGEARLELRYVPTSGVEAGGPVMWFGDVAPDQRPSDAYSLVFDSEPLAGSLEILGLPRALLQVSASAIQADWMARLEDVAPDGTTTLVASAAQNGAHRDSARAPRALVPGERFALPIEMHFSSWVFPPGHRLRFAVSNAQWPMLWPTPYPMTTSLYLGPGGTQLLLPVIPAGRLRAAPAFQPIEVDGEPLPGFGSLDLGTPSGYGEIASVERNPRTGDAKVVATNNSAERFPWGEEYDTDVITHLSNDQHPERTSVRGEYTITVKLKDRTLRWESTVEWRSDRDNFYYTGNRRLLKDGVLIREQHWDDAIARDHQ